MLLMGVISGEVKFKIEPGYIVDLRSTDFEIPTFREFEDSFKNEMSNHILNLVHGVKHLTEYVLGGASIDNDDGWLSVVGLLDEKALIVNEFNNTVLDTTGRSMENFYLDMLLEIQGFIFSEVDNENLPDDYFLDAVKKIKKYFIKAGGNLEDLMAVPHSSDVSTVRRRVEKVVKGDLNEEKVGVSTQKVSEAS